VGRWRWQGRCCGRFPLWRDATERRSRRGNDSGRLGAHAENAPTAGGEDLEVELVESDAEGFAGFAERLLDGLAGEFAVGTHVNVVSLVGLVGRALAGAQCGRP
jgi:hypothetical protein